MLERQTTSRTPVTPANSLGSVFGDDSVFAPNATVSYGVYRETIPPDQTVGEIRRTYRDRLGLADRAAAFLEGRPVNDDERVGVGQTLTFMHRAGEKGARARLRRSAFAR